MLLAQMRGAIRTFRMERAHTSARLRTHSYAYVIARVGRIEPLARIIMLLLAYSVTKLHDVMMRRRDDVGQESRRHVRFPFSHKITI